MGTIPWFESSLLQWRCHSVGRFLRRPKPGVTLVTTFPVLLTSPWISQFPQIVMWEWPEGSISQQWQPDCTKARGVPVICFFEARASTKMQIILLRAECYGPEYGSCHRNELVGRSGDWVSQEQTLGAFLGLFRARLASKWVSIYPASSLRFLDPWFDVYHCI